MRLLFDIYHVQIMDGDVVRNLRENLDYICHIHVAGVPTHAIPSSEQSSEAVRTRQWREVGLGAQILKDLGITSIRLLTSRKLTYVGIAGFGIEIVSTEKLDG